MPSIHYLSHHDLSGYAIAGRRLVLALESIGCSIRWTPLLWDSNAPITSGDQPSPIGLDRLRDVDIDPDAVIIHATPEFIPALERLRPPGVPLILHTVWEHEVLQPHWPNLINRCDAVIVPTEWNAKAFRAAGISIPVIVLPHIHDLEAGEPETAWLDEVFAPDPDTVLFHSVAMWSARKTPWKTLEAYAGAFSAGDNVAMALRTSLRIDGDVEPVPGPEHLRWFSAWSAAQIMHRHAPAPPLHLMTEAISFSRLTGLRARSNAWISLPRAEGWDLGCFDAAVAGCPVITTGYGAPLEYLDPALCDLIPGALIDVGWLPGAQWMEPDIDTAVEALRRLNDDPGAARARAELQAVRLRARYAPAVVAAELLAGLHSSPVSSAAPVSSNFSISDPS